MEFSARLGNIKRPKGALPFPNRVPASTRFCLYPLIRVVMTPVPIPAVVVIPVIVVVIIIAMPIFGMAIIASTVFVFFDFTPGCCHQQTGQAE